jgi:hypothetical protein
MLSNFVFVLTFSINDTVYCTPLENNLKIGNVITFAKFDFKQYFPQNILSHFVHCPSIFRLPSATRCSVMAIKQRAKQNV